MLYLIKKHHFKLFFCEYVYILISLYITYIFISVNLFSKFQGPLLLERVSWGYTVSLESLSKQLVTIQLCSYCPRRWGLFILSRTICMLNLFLNEFLTCILTHEWLTGWSLENLYQKCKEKLSREKKKRKQKRKKSN